MKIHPLPRKKKNTCVHSFIKDLQLSGMISVESTKEGTLITLMGVDEYDDD
jgi:hypothetical protein